MTNKNGNTGILISLVILGLLLVSLVSYNIVANPKEIVVEKIVEVPVFIEVEQECPVCEVCAVCDVCPTYDEELVEQQEVKNLVSGLVDDLVGSDDFSEDLIVFLESEYWVVITDKEDDLISVVDRDLKVMWNVDDEEGAYEFELKVKFYTDDNREDYLVKYVTVTGEFDSDDLEDFEEDGLEGYVFVSELI